MRLEHSLNPAYRLYAALAVLLVIVFSRAMLLEYTDLIDPTEARYAVVAQEMANSGNWVTPKLPTAEGIMPYMGKPPLHFWLTALCYNLFGIDEWTSRLPSIFAALLSICCIFLLVANQRKAGQLVCYEKALMTGLVLFTSAMYFFLAGASVTDTTLTACITVAIVFMYLHLTDIEHQSKYCMLAAAFAALGFLSKGPVAIVLIGLPFMLWSVVNRDFKWLKKIYWIKSTILFLLIVCPWFLINEYFTPGSLKYFLWNENIARYLFKDYGDLYGTGHRQPYGTSWLMLFAGFAPWVFVPFVGLYLNGFKASWQWIKADQFRLFAFCWTMAAPLFFTFVKQLHAMYLLPAFPGAAIFTVEIYSSLLKKSDLIVYQRLFLRSLIVLAAGIAVAGLILDFSWGGVIRSGLSISLGIYGYYFVRNFSSSLKPIAISAVLLTCVYLTVISSLSEYIGARRSAENMLKEISRMGIKNVTVLSKNSYSHYWTAEAWEEELINQVKIDFKNADMPELINSQYLLIKKDNNDLQLRLADKYVPLKIIGEWELFSLKA